MLGATVIAMDGPDHTRLRRLVARSFTPRAADRHREVMRSLVDEQIDGFAGRGRCEFVPEFADHYPVQVICEVLGVPRADHHRFAEWGDTLMYLLSLELGPRTAEVEQAASELSEYVDALVEERRAEPRDDLVSRRPALLPGRQSRPGGDAGGASHPPGPDAGCPAGR